MSYEIGRKRPKMTPKIDLWSECKMRNKKNKKGEGDLVYMPYGLPPLPRLKPARKPAICLTL